MTCVDDVREVVRLNPGLSMPEILDALNIPNSSSNNTNTRRKLNTLIRFKIIRGVKEPSKKKTGMAMILHYYYEDD